MPRKQGIPEMKPHKASGQAYVRLDGKFHYLGKHGTPEAKAAYDRAILEWLSRDKRPKLVEADRPKVKDVIAAFMAHAIGYYRSATGRPTGEADNLKEALRPVRRLYADLDASGFGTDQLKAVRQAMIDSGLSRSTINQRINRVRRAFKWAVAEKMVDVSVYATLQTLDPLRKNRSRGVKESRAIEPVPDDRIEAVLPHVPRAVAAMIQVQRLTGCRVGEVCSMRAGDVVTTCDPWEYRPGRHKSDYRENARRKIIPIGPRAQEIIRPFLEGKDADAFLFDPKASVAEALKTGRVRRSIVVKSYYDRRAYTQAIYRGCDRAFPHPVISKIKRSRTRKLTAPQDRELKEWRKANRWSPLQIRHATATEVRREFGIEAAQAMLGHAKLDTTEIYAEKQLDLAKRIARAKG